MKFAAAASTLLFTSATYTNAFAFPADLGNVFGDAPSALISRDPAPMVENSLEPLTLEKRKGGGGGRGGGVSSSSSSGKGSGGGSSSSSSGSSSGGSRGSSSSSAGGARTYSGGRYGGGATSPYRAGARRGRIAPYALAGGAAGFLIGGALVGGIYLYDRPDRVTYHNDTSGRDNTDDVRCWCAQDEQCSCDDLDDDDERDFIESVIGDGSYQTMLANNVTRLSNNTLYIDGSVPNGASTSSDNESSAAGFGLVGLAQNAGLVAIAAGVGSAVFLS